MTSTSSTNSAAAPLVLQQTGSAANATASAGPQTDLVKIASGAPTISSEPSKASAQAAGAAGKFALDTAPSVGTDEGLSDDGSLAAGMAAASNAAPVERSEKELIEMMDAFDALSIRLRLDSLHENMHAGTLKNCT